MGISQSYQGFPLRSMRFRRTRGFGATVSELVIPVEAFPKGFDFSVPAPPPNGLGTRPSPKGQIDVSALTAKDPREAVLPKKLSFEGSLVFGEHVDGETWRHPPVNLFVLRIETVRQEDEGPIAFVKLICVDERYLYTRGVIARWSFNRLRGDGTVAQDSVKDGGDLFTKAEISDEVSKGIFRRPSLTERPKSWDDDKSGADFRPWQSGIGALATMIVDEDLVDVCFRLDSTLALHKPGDGFVGYTPDGKGKNSRAFPPEVRLYKDGAGQKNVIEAGYPDDFLLVVGGVRVVTVAVDDWEPVLDVAGQIVPLDENTVRVLTGGKQGLEWLQHFVMTQQAYQGQIDLPDLVLQLLREQAWYLWRLRDAVVRKEAEGGEELAAQQQLEEAFGGEAGPSEEPGPNAHLLPLQPRAEMTAGRRWAVTVETYRWQILHREMRAESQTTIDLANVLRELGIFREAIILEAIERGNTSPWSGETRVSRDGIDLRPALVGAFGVVGGVLGEILGAEGDATRVAGGGRLSVEDLSEAIPELDTLGEPGVDVTLEDLQRAVNRARLLDRIKNETSEASAREYEQLLIRQLQLQEETGDIGAAGEVELLDLGKKLVKFEQEALAAQQTGETIEEAAERLTGSRQALANEVRKTREKVARDRQEALQRTRVGATAGRRPPTSTNLINMPRSVDTGARVYNKQAGIVRTSERAGHAAKEGVPAPSSTHFIPCPVRVIFGAVARPRTDVPPGQGARPRTGGTRARGGQAGAQAAAPAAAAPSVQPTGLPALDAAVAAEATRERTQQLGEESTEAEGQTCPGGEDEIPEVLTDQETFYTAAFKRTASGAERIDLAQLELSQTTPIERLRMIELVPLSGTSNKAGLDEVAQVIANGYMTRPEKTKTTTHILGRPWPVQCDGLVDSVEIRTVFSSEGGPDGFETVVIAGNSESVSAATGGTRPRYRQRQEQQPDSASREGLTP